MSRPSADDSSAFAAEPLVPPVNPAQPTSAADTPPIPERVTSRGPGGTPSKLRAGVVAGAAVALAVGAVATSLAASPGPSASTVPSVTTPAAPGTNSGPKVGFPGGFAFGGPGGFAGPGDLGDRGGFGRGFADITITSVSGSDVALKTDDGWTRTVTVTSSTTITKAGQTIAVSDLAAGDQVRLGQTKNADGSYTVTSIVVVVPSVQGTASAVTSSGFKVTARDGSVWTITVDGSTDYHFGTGDGSSSDVKDGTIVRVQGESTGDNALKALSVQVAGDHVAGTVTGKTADTITVKTRDGKSVTVNVSSSTTYRVAGKDPATLADVTVNQGIVVDGRNQSDGSIDAATVASGPFGGHGGFGKDHDGDHSNPDASPAPTATP